MTATPLTIDRLRAHLNLDGDDDALLQAKLDAAASFVAALTDPALAGAPALDEATLQLAAHFYENREGVGFDRDTLPASIMQLLSPFRVWC